MRLLPTDERFFELLHDLADQIPESARRLRDLLAQPLNSDGLIDEIKQLEHEADGFAHELSLHLSETFVTPLEPEDIAALAFHLDNVIDLIDGTAQRVRTFHICTTRKHATAMADIVVRAATRLDDAVAHLHRPRIVLQDIGDVHPLEEEGDQLYSMAIGSLFEPAENADALEVIKWKEMFDRLERSTNASGPHRCCSEWRSSMPRAVLRQPPAVSGLTALALILCCLRGEHQAIAQAVTPALQTTCRDALAGPVQVAACKRIASAVPSQSAAHHNLGRALALAGQDSAAIVEFKTAISLDRRNVDAYGGLARSLNVLGRFSEAIDAAHQSARFGAATADLYYTLGYAYERLGRLDASLIEFDEGVRLNPRSPQLRAERGVVLHRLGRFNDALASFAVAAKLDQQRADYWGGIAMSALGLKKSSLALAAWREAERQDASYFASHPEESAFRSQILSASKTPTLSDADALRSLVAAGDPGFPVK